MPYRDMTGLGIKEVRDKVVSAPCILLETSSLEEAEYYKIPVVMENIDRLAEIFDEEKIMRERKLK